MQMGPVLGVLGTFIGMGRAYSALAMGAEASEGMIADHVSLVLISTAIGLLFSCAGWILLLVAIFAKRYRAKWLFSFLIVYGIPVLMFAAFRITMIFWLPTLIYALLQRDVFLAKPEPMLKNGMA